MAVERVPAPIIEASQEGDWYYLTLQYHPASPMPDNTVRLRFKTKIATDAARTIDYLRNAYGWDLQ